MIEAHRTAVLHLTLLTQSHARACTMVERGLHALCSANNCGQVGKQAFRMRGLVRYELPVISMRRS